MEVLRQKYLITATKNVRKSFGVLPHHVQERLGVLLKQLALQGPVAYNWPNYGKLGKNRYHCHLKYHYVACWTCEENSISIEVYYVGSRENSPY
jgi:hypothetical protein